MTTRRKWNELSSLQRRAIVVAGVAEIALLAAALLDIKRRPAEGIRGPKWMWRGLAFVSFVGPLSYFICGRRRAEPV